MSRAGTPHAPGAARPAPARTGTASVSGRAGQIPATAIRRASTEPGPVAPVVGVPRRRPMTGRGAASSPLARTPHGAVPFETIPGCAGLHAAAGRVIRSGPPCRCSTAAGPTPIAEPAAAHPTAPPAPVPPAVRRMARPASRVRRPEPRAPRADRRAAPPAWRARGRRAPRRVVPLPARPASRPPGRADPPTLPAAPPLVPGRVLAASHGVHDSRPRWPIRAAGCGSAPCWC